MSRGLEILSGISKWIRESVGPEAENRGQDGSDEDAEADDENGENGESNGYDSPVCCSAASSTDLTVFDE